MGVRVFTFITMVKSMFRVRLYSMLIDRGKKQNEKKTKKQKQNKTNKEKHQFRQAQVKNLS